MRHYRNLGIYMVDSYSIYMGRNYSEFTVMDEFGNLVFIDMNKSGYSFVLMEMAESNFK